MLTMPVLAPNPPLHASGHTRPLGDQASRLRALFGAADHAPSDLERQTRPVLSPASRVPVVAIASGKGGVGKTSIAVNLAIVMARAGLRTTLLDGDLGVANADVLLGINPAARLEHVMAKASMAGGGGERGATLADIAIDAPGGFKLVPGSVGLARMADLSASERRWLGNAIAELEATSDLVLIDTGAGVGPIVRTFVAAADMALIVSTPEPTAITDAYALIKCIRTGGLPQPDHLALIVNEARDEAEAANVHQRIAGAATRFLGTDLPLMAAIAQDTRIAAAVRARRPFALSDPMIQPSIAISTLCDRILNQLCIAASRPPLDVVAPQASLTMWLAGLLRV